MIFIEDRLSADSGKFGPTDRIPHVLSANATFSRNLFMPIDKDEYFNLPVMDVFVNGQHFIFTVAGLKTLNEGAVGTTADNEFDPDNLYEVVPNHPQLPFDPDCNELGLPLDYCFDLNRDGTVDVLEEQQEDFAWQWQKVDLDDINLEQGEHVVLDVDRDLKEERIIYLSEDKSEMQVIDNQEGDFDFSLNTRDFDILGEKRPGFQQNMTMYTYSKNPNTGGETFYLMEEGRLYQGLGDDKQYIRSVQKKDQLDVIERTIQLSNDTQHYCAGSTVVTEGMPENNTHGGWDDQDLSNPVEVCCQGTSGGGAGITESCCFGANQFMTCMDTNPDILTIFVRSRIEDKRGRKWVTPYDYEGVEFRRD